MDELEKMLVTVISLRVKVTDEAGRCSKSGTRANLFPSISHHPHSAANIAPHRSELRHLVHSIHIVNLVSARKKEAEPTETIAMLM